jgi:nucleoside-diphosphate-sugar epimerase
MRCLITGATGFLGGEVVRQLQGDGHELSALVRRPDRVKGLIGVKIVPGDVTDRASVRSSVQGMDAVLHLAAWYEVGRSNPEAVAINVEGTRHVLEEAAQAGVNRIVHTSSLAVNSDTRGRVVDESYVHTGPHLSQYDDTKARAHYEVAFPLAVSGAPIVIVQPGVIYGPGDHSAIGAMFRDWMLGKPIPHCPTASYCWGHVEDTARGLIAALDLGKVGESYIIAGPVHTLGEAFAIGAEITGRRPPGPALPASVLRAMERVVRPFARALPFLRPQLELLRVGPATYLGDSTKASMALGWSPRPLREGLGQLLPTLPSGPTMSSRPS